MLRHYILISWRNIIRNKFYSVILVLGLAVGIASTLLLGLYTWDEMTVDSFHEKKDRIFLVGVDSKAGEEEYRGGYTTPPTGPALLEHFAEIESFARLAFWFDDVVVAVDDKKFVETGVVGADSSVFDIFTIPFIAGDARTALRKPNTIVISKKTAEKYFGDQDPIGKSLSFDHFVSECEVTGVIENYPVNSHLHFDILLSLSSFKAINFDFADSWGNHTFSTYVLLDGNTTPGAIEAKTRNFLQEYMDPYLVRKYKKTYEELYTGGDHYDLFLTPLKDIHLSTLIHENQEGKRTLVNALGLISLIILILVCVNYTNLASVLALSRTREAGIRKVTGSKSGALFKQAITESIVMAATGLFLGLVLVECFLPSFNILTKKSLIVAYSDPVVAFGLIGFALFIGFMSGLYPALTFASFNPVQALKGNSVTRGSYPWLRSALVVFQFSICVIMIVSTLVVYKQLKFMTDKNPGFSKDQVLVIKRAEGLKANKSTFKNVLLNGPGIFSASYTETIPGRNFNGQTQHLAGRPSTENPVIYPFIADQDIFQTLGIELLQGASFKDEPGPSNAILNEAAVETLGLSTPLDETIDEGTMGRRHIDIIGVVRDFHFKSFHHRIEPLVIFPLDVDNDPYHNATYLLVKVDPRNIPATLRYIEQEWKKVAGNYPFDFSFMDEDFNRLFARERTMASVYTTFSGISVLIACLGLLGLVSFFANKRTKEIGIRKIVGASIGNIGLLLSRQFIQWIAVSIVIGSSVAWYVMDAWLDNFAYQTAIPWWIFAMAGMCIVAVVLITTGWQLYKAACRNPVDALRYE